MSQGHLRSRRRWTMTDVVAAQQRMHELTKTRGYAIEPVSFTIAERKKSAELAEATARLERVFAETEKPKLEIAPVAYRPTPCPEPFGGFSFRLPWAPSVNTAYANRASGEGKGRIKTSKARAYAQLVWIELLRQKVQCRSISHPLAISIIQHASADRGDVDNGLKVVIDCLKRYGVIADDNRSIVKRVSIEDGERVKAGDEYIEVHISCVNAN